MAIDRGSGTAGVGGSITPSDNNFIVGDGKKWVVESGAVARASLGLVLSTDVQPYDADLTAIAAFTHTNGNFIVSNGSAWVLEAGATARASLGLVIGTDIQAYDAELAAIAGLTSAADRVPYFTGLGTASLATLTAAGRALIDDADVAAQRTTLGLGTANNVQFSGLGLGLALVSGTRLTLPQENDSVTPTLAFGDGDTGLYESANDTLRFALGGVSQYFIASSRFSAISGASLYNRSPSATVPTLVPTSGDSNTGIGTAADDQLSLITGGVESARFSVAASPIFATELAVTEGGTGASTAAAARTNLGLVISTDVQAYDAGLADLASLAVTKGNVIVGDGSNWKALGVGTDDDVLTADAAQANGIKWAAGGSGSSPTTTRGDIIRRNATVDERLAIGTADKVLTSDGTDPAWATPVISESYDSGEQTITSAGALTLAHSLNTTPTNIVLYLKCKTADIGYSVGDEVLISYNAAHGTAASRGVSVVPDATNINIRFGSTSTVFSLIHKSSGAANAIAANSNWKLIVRAWA